MPAYLVQITYNHVCRRLPSKKNGGFVFFDFLLSLMIFSLALFGLANVFTKVKLENSNGRMMSVAVSVGTQRLEDLKSRAKIAFVNVTTVDWKPVEGSSGLLQRTEVVDNSATLKTVRVRTAWHEHQHEAMLETMVARQ